MRYLLAQCFGLHASKSNRNYYMDCLSTEVDKTLTAFASTCQIYWICAMYNQLMSYLVDI